MLLARDQARDRHDSVLRLTTENMVQKLLLFVREDNEIGHFAHRLHGAKVSPLTVRHVYDGRTDLVTKIPFFKGMTEDRHWILRELRMT